MNHIEDYLKYIKVLKKYSNYTIENYKKDIYNFYDFNNDILNINDKNISEYLEYLYSKKLNRNSISRQLSALRSFYNYLEKEEIIKTNYFNNLKNPKKNGALPKYAKNDDLEKMFLVYNKNDALSKRNLLILEMLYATGIRVGELVNIKISDIDFYNNEIKIIGKGRKNRMVIYGSYCANALDNYLDSARSELEKEKNDYLFLNKYGGKLSERYVRTVIDNAVKKCMINYHISPHTLRHTFATDMLNAGADLMTVKELLGHSSVNTTGIYTHVSNEQLKKVYTFAHPRSQR